MLQTVNLTKIYKTKKGVRVKAIDGVSIKFPEKGMVFLLGKSGSGKSTLLNLLGGLDRCDGGDIIIKGVSSKSFKQEHFDSYRNTYVGFIFQEYNILDEFSVGANIALAIELQGKKATDKAINDILHRVDLDGYGNRKPNELSGGQKQRVAIARALVKNPEIIMADEPTGALDSGTGAQVLDTLKRLSEDKLVIVVSHDREFAEKYADRIIELADGKVINDEELFDNKIPGSGGGTAYDEQTERGTDCAETAQGMTFSGRTIRIPQHYHITEEDRAAINDFIDRLNRSGAESGAEINISDQAGTGRRRTKTDQNKITYTNSAKFSLIKSRLPMKSAFKIGANSLKYKKIRLAVTILLSCISFGLFGMADTLGSYDHVNVCAKSIVDSDINYASFSKAYRRDLGTDEWYYQNGFSLSEEDIAQISKNCGIDVQGVYAPAGAYLDISESFDTTAKFTQTDYNIYTNGLNGFAEIKAGASDAAHRLYAGRWPNGDKNEIAISKYVCETYIIGGYRENSDQDFEKIKDYADMVGKKLILNGQEYTITGIFDTGMDLNRFRSLTEKKEYMTAAEEAVEVLLYSELRSLCSYSLDNVAIVGEGFIERMIGNTEPVYEMESGYLNFYTDKSEYYAYIYPSYLAYGSEYPEEDIIWTDDERSDRKLKSNEIIVSVDILQDIALQLGLSDTENYAEIAEAAGVFTSSGWDYINDEAIPGAEYSIAGYIDPEKSSAPWLVVAPDALTEKMVYGDGIYSYAVGAMPESLSDIKTIAEYCYRDGEEVRYSLENSVTHELDYLSQIISDVAKYALYAGIAFALFAALMLANFISTSISYKKQEIGILRAIGSRSNDVFRIFFSESFIIALINFVLSAAGVGIVTYIINKAIRLNTGILITILSFGLRQIALLFVISMLIAAVASFIPVKKIASKRPIDAIRDR